MKTENFTLPVYNMKGQEVGTISVTSDQLGGLVRSRLVKDVVVLQARNRRQGNANTKTRREIITSGKKPWKQKGTGRARSGKRSSNIWRKGYKAMGPKTMDYHREIPVGMRRLALASAVLGKIKDKEIKLVEEFKFDKASSRAAAGMLKALDMNHGILLANHHDDEKAWKSFRNLCAERGLLFMKGAELNALDVLSKKKLLITKKAFEDMVERVGAS